MDLFTLVAKIVLDTKEYDKGIDEAEKRGSKFGEAFQGVGNAFQGVGKVASGVAKATGAAVAAASGAVAKLTTSSVKAYAQFQQLEGGVDTLFGTNGKKTLEDYQKALNISEKSTKKQVDASIKSFQSHQKAYNIVMNNSKTAFRRAGMDQNSYIENVTSFSAALIKSLDGDTEAAAEAADNAIVAMSDNANKMGTDIQSIQNAYQGFAKGNFTMLDNLKLGYGGTRSEMQKLLKDAEKLSGNKYNIDNLKDIYQAIQDIQDNMGITGTTFEEAEHTISGSIDRMKSAWSDFKKNLADPDGDLKTSIDNLIESAKIAAGNLVPVIKTALDGFGTLVDELAPVISEELPGLIDQLLPSLIQGGITMVTGLAQGLVSNLPALAEAAKKILDTLITEFGKSDSPILQAVSGALSVIRDVFDWIINNQSTAVAAITAIGTALATWKVIKGLDSVIKTVQGLGLGGGNGGGGGGTPTTPTTPTTNPTVPVVPGSPSTPTTDPGWMKPGMFNMGVMTPDFIGDYFKLTDPVRQLEQETAGMTESEKQRYTFVKQLIDGGATPAEAAKEANKFFYGKKPTLEVTTGKTTQKDRTGQHSFWNTVENRNANKTNSTYEELLDPNSNASQLLNSGAEEYFNPTEKPKPAKTPAKNGMKQVREYQEMQELLDPNSPTSKKLKELTEKGIEVPVKPKEIEKFVEEVEQGAQEKPPQIELKPKENAAQELSDGVGTVDVKTKSVWSTLFQTAQDYFNNNELITKFKGKWSELIEKGKEALSNNPFGLKTVADWIEFFKNGQEQANRTELSVPTDLQPDPNEAEELAAEVGTVTTKTEVEAEEGANSKLARQIGTVHVPVSFVGGAGGGGGGGGGSRNNMTGGYLALHAKGDWDIPFDNYPALLHRNEMVLTASQARRYREGEDNGSSNAVVEAIQQMRNDLRNIQLVVGQKVFGNAVVDYGGRKMNDYIGEAESMLAAGYGT